MLLSWQKILAANLIPKKLGYQPKDIFSKPASAIVYLTNWSTSKLIKCVSGIFFAMDNLNIFNQLTHSFLSSIFCHSQNANTFFLFLANVLTLSKTFLFTLSHGRSSKTLGTIQSIVFLPGLERHGKETHKTCEKQQICNSHFLLKWKL